MAVTAGDALEALMTENDQDLYLWISGAVAHPEAHGPIIAHLRRFHDIPARGAGPGASAR